MPTLTSENVGVTIQAHAPNSLKRLIVNNAHGWMVRMPIAIVLSGFLFFLVNTAACVSWLGVTLALEGLLAVVERLGRQGNFRFKKLFVPLLCGLVCAYCVLAVLLWLEGSVIARIAALITLFSVALYGPIGAYQNLKAMMVLTVLPLLTLFVLVMALLWSESTIPFAILGTLATLGSCATILINGVALNASDRALIRTADALKQERDLLEERVIERTRALEDALHAARAASQAKTRFLETMSHELRTPLNTIIGYTEMARDDVAEGILPPQKDIEKVLACGHRLTQMINDLFEAVQGEDKDVVLESIDVHALFDEIKVDFDPVASAKGLSIALDIQTGGEHVLGDRAMLARCLKNLTSNALSFSTAGEVKLSSLRIPGEAGNAVRLQVIDNGLGIPEDKIEAVFEPFVQVDDSMTRQHQGTGLGLFITRSLVRKMTGSISLNSALGEGTTASITLAAA